MGGYGVQCTRTWGYVMRLLFDFVIIFHGTFEAFVDVTLCSSCGTIGICINIWLKRSPGGIWIRFFTHFALESLWLTLRHFDTVFATFVVVVECRAFQLAAISSGIASVQLRPDSCLMSEI